MAVLLGGHSGAHLRKEIFVPSSDYMVYEQSHAIYGDMSSGRYFVSESKYDEMARFQLLPDDLIMSCSGTIGKVSIVPDGAPKGIINQALLKIRLDQGKARPKYIGYFLGSSHFSGYVAALSIGTAMENIASVRQISQLPVPLPPLPEQKRIAAILNEQMAAVEKAKKAAEERLKAAKALPAAYLREVFEGQEAKGWPRRPLGEVSVLERGRFTPRPRNDPRYYGGEHPWIQIGEVEVSTKYIDHYRATLNDEGLAVSKKFPRGTLVISIAATIGAVGILTLDSCMPDSLVGIKPIEGKSISNFLYHLMFYTRNHLERIAPQMAQANINLSILNSLELPFPQLGEQTRIAANLDDEIVKGTLLEQSIQQEIETIKAMPAALLRKAFSGEL